MKKLMSPGSPGILLKGWRCVFDHALYANLVATAQVPITGKALWN